MQDTLAIWAVYMTMTKDNKMALFQIMEAKVAELIGESNDMTWCIADDTAGIQASIIVHIT